MPAKPSSIRETEVIRSEDGSIVGQRQYEYTPGPHDVDGEQLDRLLREARADGAEFALSSERLANFVTERVAAAHEDGYQTGYDHGLRDNYVFATGAHEALTRMADVLRESAESIDPETSEGHRAVRAVLVKAQERCAALV